MTNPTPVKPQFLLDLDKVRTVEDIKAVLSVLQIGFTSLNGTDRPTRKVIYKYFKEQPTEAPTTEPAQDA